LDTDILEKEMNKAEKIILRVLPDDNERKVVLLQLFKSVQFVNGIAPSSWAVSLLNDGFRLNVGQVEVVTFCWQQLRVNIAGKAGITPYDGEMFINTDYRSQPYPQCAFVGSVAQFERVKKIIQAGHKQFLKQAASTQTGNPRKGTPFRRSHCEELIQYARDILGIGNNKMEETSIRLSQEEWISSSPLVEGARLTIQVNAFERNPEARSKCIDYYGARCMVCGFSFEDTYGPVAKDYIHVHHLKPLSLINQEYTVDPIKNLRPVCPNCHAMIHQRTPPYRIEEVKAMLEIQKRRQGKKHNP
jgi:5-methylcytosine-specific restriction protein A